MSEKLNESANPWDWLLAYDGSDWLEQYGEIRETIEDFPVTKLSFRLSEVLPHESRDVVYAPEALRHIGAWPWPSLQGRGSPRRYVNPTAADARLYPGVSAECSGCSAQIAGLNLTADHRPDCLRPATIEEAIRGEQAAVIEAAGERLVPRERVARRLGIEPDGFGRLIDRVETDWQAARERGYRYRTRIWERLAERGATQREIGEAFGVTRGTVSNFLTADGYRLTR